MKTIIFPPYLLKKLSLLLLLYQTSSSLSSFCLPKMTSLLQASRPSSLCSVARMQNERAKGGRTATATATMASAMRATASSLRRQSHSPLAPASNPLLSLSRRGPAAPSGVRTWLRNTISDFGRVRDGLRGREKERKREKGTRFLFFFDLLSPSPLNSNPFRSLRLPLSLSLARATKQTTNNPETPPEHPRRLLHRHVGRGAGRAPLGGIRAARGRLAKELREGAIQGDDGRGVRVGTRLELDARDGRPRGLGRVRRKFFFFFFFLLSSRVLSLSRTRGDEKRGFFFLPFSPKSHPL